MSERAIAEAVQRRLRQDKPGVRSMLEILFWQQLVDAKLADDCERELVFAKPRKWRFDFAFPKQKLALEVEGGTWVNGAHGRGRHFESDCEKYAEAVILGWRVLRVTTDMVNDGRAIAFLKRAWS